MSSKGQKVPSARHRFSLKRIIACIVVCAVAFCAVLTGMGYGLGWFSSDAELPQNASEESAESEERNIAKNEAEDNASEQGEDASAEEEETATDPADDQTDQANQPDKADEVAAESGSNASVTQEETPENVDEGITFDVYSGEESASVENQSSDQNASSALDGTSSQKQSDASGQSANNSSSSDTGNGQSLDGANSTQKNDAGESTDQIVTVSVYIDSSRAAPYGYPSCLGDMTVSIAQGSSVLDALKATGLAISATNSGYVSSISGLQERACGSGSGWLYFVDGVSPSSSCSKYILNGGEKIEWIYTCNMGNDV